MEQWDNGILKLNPYMVAAKWMQLRGETKQRWSHLTDSELDKASGKSDAVAGLLEAKYGYTNEKAHQEVDSFLTEHENE
jgi:uncharacterized protein YjbJ (UPF0337 family)